MRKECKTAIKVNVGHIQGYHGNEWSGESYAFHGFPTNEYFNSDRTEPTAVVDGKLVRLDKKTGLPSGLPMETVGLEVEVECNGIVKLEALSAIAEHILFPNFKYGDRMFKMQHDGSLGGATSVEIITQPMTIAKIRNDYPAWKAMFEYMRKFDMSADSYDTDCGMHVNLGVDLFGKTEEEQKENLRKLYFLINNRYKFFRNLFYRSQYKSGWCLRMESSKLADYYIPYAEELDFHNARNLDFDKVTGDHHFCLNYSHFKAGRIEIRLVGGQRDFDCFRETMECVFWIVGRIGTLRWDDLDDLVKVFKGCNQYVISRIESMCMFDRGFNHDMLMKLKNACEKKDYEVA